MKTMLGTPEDDGMQQLIDDMSALLDEAAHKATWDMVAVDVLVSFGFDRDRLFGTTGTLSGDVLDIRASYWLPVPAEFIEITLMKVGDADADDETPGTDG